MSSFDITFCSYYECQNKECERHKNRLENYHYPVSVADFPKCEHWKDGKHSLLEMVRKL